MDLNRHRLTVTLHSDIMGNIIEENFYSVKPAASWPTTGPGSYIVW